MAALNCRIRGTCGLTERARCSARRVEIGTGEGGELVRRASQQLTELVPGELPLAQVEMAEMGKRYGKGSGLFGGAGLVGFLMLQALVATAIAPAGAVAGKKQASRAAPPTPEQTLHKESAKR
ncbi:phage holin family protein [Streptomyces sp. NPDC057798]|uniref:phage holin family protein n=1 Tax=Streptomyces sp. NPDC057798 TaxID=3346252 RepID=UPI0036D086B8